VKQTAFARTMVRSAGMIYQNNLPDQKSLQFWIFSYAVRDWHATVGTVNSLPYSYVLLLCMTV